jgi:hypothetical protein
MNEVKEWFDKVVEVASKVLVAATGAAIIFAVWAVVMTGACFVFDILAPIVGARMLYAIAVGAVFGGLTAVLYEGR